MRDTLTLVDRRGLEPRLLTCKASVIPPILAAHEFLVPPAGLEPATSALSTRYSTNWVIEAINTFMKTYKNITPGGLNFHLSLIDGVCCMIVYDRFFCEYHMQYFTNVNKALRFINNLWLVEVVRLELTINTVWRWRISRYAILPYRNTLACKTTINSTGTPLLIGNVFLYE